MTSNNEAVWKREINLWNFCSTQCAIYDCSKCFEKIERNMKIVLEVVVQEPQELLKISERSRMESSGTNHLRRNSSRKLSKDLHISRYTLRQIMKNDFGLKSWKRQKRPMLTDDQKVERLKRVKVMKRNFAANRHRSIRVDILNNFCCFLLFYVVCYKISKW